LRGASWLFFTNIIGGFEESQTLPSYRF